MESLNSELTSLNYNLQGSAFQSDYPEIDRTIDFKGQNEYLKENAEDYIIRVNEDYYEYPSNILPDENELKYKINHPKEAYEKAAEEVNKEITKSGFDISEIMQNFFTEIYLTFLELLEKPKFNENYLDYYTSVLSKNNRYIFLVFLVILICSLFFITF